MSNKTITPGTGFDLDNPNQSSVNDGPVECLGKTFTNDTERRDYYLGLLAEKLKDPEYRKIEGFPVGEDEDILELSDPPYYTACPNPFVEEFVAYYGRPYDSTEEYKREPYAADVSEGKNDPIYNAHSYHTKVPHKAIMRYILHYTNPGDIVFDGFCGTGMTGVAAQMCGDKEAVESLGYRVLSNGDVLSQELSESWKKISELGARRTVLNDLSPAATFIAKNYNTPESPGDFIKEADKVLQRVKEQCYWMYKTRHSDGTEGIINYTVWSDIFACPECGGDIVFWDVAVDQEQGKVKDKFSCNHCNSSLTKKKLDKRFKKKFDAGSGEVVGHVEQHPVRINYKVGSKNFDKVPDESDLEIIQSIEEQDIPFDFPVDELPDGFNTRQPKGSHGYTRVHHFYTKRNLFSLAALRSEINQSAAKAQLLCLVGDQLPRASKMHKIAVSRLNTNLSKTAGILAGTLYIPSNQIEYCLISMVEFRIKDVSSYLGKRDNRTRQLVSTGSASEIRLPDNSLDYFFFDPPFGANLNYSELNFLWEAWLRVATNNKSEAIENKVQNKSLSDYRSLMQLCFEEAYRMLKPGRWMTVEFSNTKSSVWNGIQTALQNAGFIVASVSALDKKQHTIKALTTSTAVKQDLIISAYKPNGGFEDRFVKENEFDGVWDFVRTHLGYLPSVRKVGGELVFIQERDPRILFDQVVSYFIRRVKEVPLSSKEFQDGLSERFSERDGMIFLSEQVAAYDKARISGDHLKQLSIFVDDEVSAIEWLRQMLNEKPQSYQDINPKFINELGGWKKSEEQLELSTLLEQSFIKYDGEGPLPPQIHSYLSTNFKEFRKLKKDDTQLIKKAKDRWYVPNPDREEDLQKLRERSLLSEFNDYKEHTGKKLKKVRMEAVRCGFKKAWQERDYPTIISVAEKIPQALLQEDQKLLMWYDQAQTRASDESLF